MSILLEPPELGFKRPFDREVCEILHLSNTNPEPVVFKVKTTAPKHYCVRPNSGRIEPGKNVDVHVLLQAMKEEPAPDAKCKDKFLVQTVAVTGDMEFSNVSSIFEKASKSSIQERKIRVNWLPAESSNGEQGKETNGISAPEEEPPSYTSPAANYQTPAVGASTKISNDTSPIPPPDFSEKPKRDTFAQHSNETSATSVKSNTSGIPASADELKTQLSEANAQIEKLKERLADQGLRQRKIGGENEKSASTMQRQQVQPVAAGVPLQIVAGLCLLSFLIAYFFF
ncbi:vesicle-associated membrane protein-associated protein C16G5.05c [Aspergillus lentulus]|uniref:Vesicle-associated membrane protein-associated protein C16G5.05c n=1 Tax=Aspergillus lentulus TaxID=293939 RepID=A0AAN4PKK9_ASPLE|nr:vesicle-associated membrane protein-associated protein C16G5.05c [Aspergillus lentulus]GAQ07858.1 vesicle-associated membrane protein-associated protein C16G5.05c [Aspergillus lentulus]GFF25235.1 vesicle-associated membrane protein-associated protein C16G5.05c [Aspergillus lentulus]GFF61054.1 vesicle-associated membrane protein-associated protein C16G5.05c [Aspergillus lentulus]GFF82431.1 vesicle-associated membrane protein-associated protein C16G5.05c [Aspergillus lentulus]GFG00168.1 vesic